MFYRDILIIWRSPFNKTKKLQAIVSFFNEEKFNEFMNVANKLHWLKEELNLAEEYFWNCYVELDEDEYIREIDDEYRLDREYSQADKFIIK
jgi:predicted solute-binding protein